MSRTNETRHIEWHETCWCKCRLDEGIYNNKQHWNDDKCRCECKELIDKGICKKGYIWNSSNGECECDKSCHVGEYVDYENCKCRKKLGNKMIKECTENVKEVKLTKMTSTENKNKHKCSSYTLYMVFFLIIFLINIGICDYFLCFYWYLKKCYSC